MSNYKMHAFSHLTSLINLLVIINSSSKHRKIQTLAVKDKFQEHNKDLENFKSLQLRLQQFNNTAKALKVSMRKFFFVVIWFQETKST